MGLDMYFCRGNSLNEESELFYFRKHSDLHGFLMNIWLSLNKNRYGNDFNCEYLEITKEILKSLEEECNKTLHQRYSGFFWGRSTIEQWEETRLELIPILYKELNEGNKVYYYSSW